MNDRLYSFRDFGEWVEVSNCAGVTRIGDSDHYCPVEDIALAAIRQLRDELAAAVAERDEARNLYQARNTEWHRCELIALALAERYKLRAERAEARLAAIDSAPTVAHLCTLIHPFVGEYVVREGEMEPNKSVTSTELIARPAKEPT